MKFELDRTEFENKLKSYQPTNEEITFKEKMLSLLAYDNCFERSLLHAHFTGSAWVIDRGQSKALFTHHAKLDRWLQLGGHADGDANICRVANCELIEESGREGFELVSEDIFDIDIHGIPAKGDIPAHDHYDVRFLFIGDANIPLSRNHESKALEWVPFSQIDDLVDGNSSIMRMLNKSLEMAL